MFLDLHSDQIEKRDMTEFEERAILDRAMTHYYGGWQKFSFKYTLKNGRRIQSIYRMYDYDTNEFLEKIYSSDVYRKWELTSLESTR